MKISPGFQDRIPAPVVHRTEETDVTDHDSHDSESHSCLAPSAGEIPANGGVFYRENHRTSWTFQPCLMMFDYIMDTLIRVPKLSCVFISDGYCLVGALEHQFHDFPFAWEFHNPN